LLLNFHLFLIQLKSVSVMKKVLFALLSLSLLGNAGCKKTNPAPSNTAGVMFVNGCAGSLPAIDARVDNININGALNLAFPSYSGYKYVKSGTPISLGFFLTNVGTPVSSQTVSLETGASYSAFCGGVITSPAFLFVKDDLTAPATNHAKVRFINLSKDGLSVTANVQTSVIGTDIRSLGVSNYLEVIAGAYELKAGDPTDISTVVTTDPKTQSLAAGKIYTLILTGTKTGTGESALKLKLITNN
jgi:hypothetical protein